MTTYAYAILAFGWDAGPAEVFEKSHPRFATKAARSVIRPMYYGIPQSYGMILAHQEHAFITTDTQSIFSKEGGISVPFDDINAFRRDMERLFGINLSPWTCKWHLAHRRYE